LLPLAAIPAAAQINLTAIVNATDYAGGSVAPGEIITLFGTGIGPPTLVSLTLSPPGTVPTNAGGAQVLFDGGYAPILYASSTQVGAIVPYEIAAEASTSVRVSYNGGLSNAIAMPVSGSAPGVFTANASGTGQGSILNQDYSVNGPSNPAAKGSVVQIFGTGEGQTSPPSQTGSFNSTSVLHYALQTVTASVGGLPAVVEFAGEAPGLVAGVFQVNVVIPANAPSGADPLVIMIGPSSTQTGVTVSVQ
jgi:uncharacterized protein (TIGR03437 family)